jgi:hypothetical protein
MAPLEMVSRPARRQLVTTTAARLFDIEDLIAIVGEPEKLCTP